MKIYPNNVAKIMSYTQMFIGLGYMLGPAIGSILYIQGGFILPFVTIGSIAFMVSVVLLAVIPNVTSDPLSATSPQDGAKTFLTFRELIKV
jgi:MFS family permease